MIATSRTDSSSDQLSMKRPYDAKVTTMVSGISSTEGTEVMSDKPQVDENTLRTMEALLRQPPKPHDQMKLGKPRDKKAASPKRSAKKSQAGAMRLLLTLNLDDTVAGHAAMRAHRAIGPAHLL